MTSEVETAMQEKKCFVALRFFSPFEGLERFHSPFALFSD